MDIVIVVMSILVFLAIMWMAGYLDRDHKQSKIIRELDTICTLALKERDYWTHSKAKAKLRGYSASSASWSVHYNQGERSCR